MAEKINPKVQVQQEQTNYMNTSLDQSPTRDMAAELNADNVVRSLDAIGQGLTRTINSVSEEVRIKQRAININKATTATANYSSYTEKFIKDKANEDGKKFHELNDDEIKAYNVQAKASYLKQSGLNKESYYQEGLEIIDSYEPKTFLMVKTLAENQAKVVNTEVAKDVTMNNIKISRNAGEAVALFQENLPVSSLSIGTYLEAKNAQLKGLYNNAVAQKDYKSMRYFRDPKIAKYFEDIEDFDKYKVESDRIFEATNKVGKDTRWENDKNESYNKVFLNQFKSQEDVDKEIEYLRSRNPGHQEDIYNLRTKLYDLYNTKSNMNIVGKAYLDNNAAAIIREIKDPKKRQEAIDQQFTETIGTEGRPFDEDFILDLQRRELNLDKLPKNQREVEAKNIFEQKSNIKQFLNFMTNDMEVTEVSAFLNSPVKTTAEIQSKMNAYQYLNEITDGRIDNHFKGTSKMDMFFAFDLSRKNLTTDQKDKMWTAYNTQKNNLTIDGGTIVHPEIRKVLDVSGNDIQDISEGKFFTQISTDTNVAQEFLKNYMTTMASTYRLQGGETADSIKKAESELESYVHFTENRDGSNTVIPREFHSLAGDKGDYGLHVMNNYIMNNPQMIKTAKNANMDMTSIKDTISVMKYVPFTSEFSNSISFRPSADYMQNQKMDAYIKTGFFKEPQYVFSFTARQVASWEAERKGTVKGKDPLKNTVKTLDENISDLQNTNVGSILKDLLYDGF